MWEKSKIIKRKEKNEGRELAEIVTENKEV